MTKWVREGGSEVRADLHDGIEGVAARLKDLVIDGGARNEVVQANGCGELPGRAEGTAGEESQDLCFQIHHQNLSDGFVCVCVCVCVCVHIHM